MVRTRSILFLFAFAVLFLAVGRVPAFGAGDDLRISADAFKKVLGSPELIVVDVRDPISWSKSDSKIKGAIRKDPRELTSWEKTFPKNKEIVFYCD